MAGLIRGRSGMNIVGQGGRIMLFMLPALLVAIGLNVYMPDHVRIPGDPDVLRPLGYVLLVPGLILWGTAVVQLVTGFSRGRLVTSGAYGVVRNPIYSSVTFFVLPAMTLITLTWVYLCVSPFLYAGVMIFIGKEERQLSAAFGKEYEVYSAKIDRMIPWKRP
jgi:protein-S-isoprenylcysteine O-methyltransferase Ste14